MATGRSIQLTKQVGEYLVAAELGRLGLLAATFSGSVPDFDIIATDQAFVSVPVQVKAVTGSGWQFDLRRFAEIEMIGDRQVVHGPRPLAADILCVLVALAGQGKDRFYVLSMTALQDLLIDHHRAYLAKHGGVRPKRVDSTHVAIQERDLAPFKDAWIKELVGRRGLKIAQPPV